MDNQQIAQAILNAVGPENITDAYNCMTRLRLRVTAVTVTKEQLKKIAGVKGVILNDGEIHVVLGPGKAENVAKECKRMLAEQEKTKAAAQTVGAEPAALSASHSVSENPKPAPAEIQKPENKQKYRNRRTKSATAKRCMPKSKKETASQP